MFDLLVNEWHLQNMDAWSVAIAAIRLIELGQTRLMVETPGNDNDEKG